MARNASPIAVANGAPAAPFGDQPNLVWGAATALERGPVIATLRNPNHRNALGTHAAGYFAGNRMLHESKEAVGRGLDE
jgi:hypothetical protein